MRPFPGREWKAGRADRRGYGCPENHGGSDVYGVDSSSRAVRRQRFGEASAAGTIKERAQIMNTVINSTKPANAEEGLLRSGRNRVTRNGCAAVLAALVATVGLGAEPDQAENFSDRAWYSLGRGAVWMVVSSNEVRQTEHEGTWKNNGFNRACAQGGVMDYAFDIRLYDGTIGAGLYVMADDTNGVDRGNSYLLWYTEGGKEGPEFSIGKFVGDKAQTFDSKTPLPTRRGEWVTLRVSMDTATGVFTIYCNGKKTAQFTDPKPIRSGTHVSLHTCMCDAAFRNLRIRQEEAAPRKKGGPASGTGTGAAAQGAR
jgi:hypothetical protein